jgi:O-antigen/teichoic acid export membrane protein
MLQNKKLVLLNVFSSAGQVVLVGLVYFFLYKFLLNSIGIELLGVWSVVLSTSSIASLANAGVITSVVRFAAIYVGDADKTKLHRLTFTATVIMVVLFVFICAVLYPFAGYILHKIIDAKYIGNAMAILPFSILCFIVNAVGGVYASILDGTQKNYIRNIIFSTSSVLLLVLSILLVNKFGFKGLAYAQLVQSIYSLSICLLVVAQRLQYNPFKWNWDKTIFKDIYAYSIKFQFISFASMLNEPLTKGLLAKYGGLAITGYYEMANRLLMQLKGVVANAYQSLIPVIISLAKDKQASVSAFYSKTFYLVCFISLSGVGMLALAAGIISNVWIGHYETIFVTVLQLLGISFFINLLNIPAYFTFMSVGNLNTLIVSHIIMAVVNALLGIILGYYFSGIGIIIAIIIATAAGSLYTILVYQQQNKIGFTSLIDSNLKIAFSVLSVLLVVMYMIPVYIKDNFWNYTANSLLVAGFMVTIYFTFLKQLDIVSLLKNKTQPVNAGN